MQDFGAVGDGVADDTVAFHAAIAATTRGAIFVPPGRYRITDDLRMEKSGVVLRGAGPARSVLGFPRGLDDVHPRQGRTSTGSPASGYSFDGAFVTLRGGLPGPSTRTDHDDGAARRDERRGGSGGRGEAGGHGVGVVA